MQAMHVWQQDSKTSNCVGPVWQQTDDLFIYYALPCMKSMYYCIQQTRKTIYWVEIHVFNKHINTMNNANKRIRSTYSAGLVKNYIIKPVCWKCCLPTKQYLRTLSGKKPIYCIISHSVSRGTRLGRNTKPFAEGCRTLYSTKVCQRLKT